jgi:DNA polymerase
MKHLLLAPDFEAWRTAAREALRAGYRPEELDLEDAAAPVPLKLALEAEEPATGPAILSPHVPAAFLDIARRAAVHRDPRRWNLLYRVLYRLQAERDLLHRETDDDIVALTRLEAQVRRDLHKMHAFVRFRKVLDPASPAERPIVIDEPLPAALNSHGDPVPAAHHLVLETPTPFGRVKSEIEECPPADAAPDEDCEHFIAWYQPDHRILPLAAPFFAERFAIMRWTILTPEQSVAWDPASKSLRFGPGVPRESAPAEDELETLWRSYYASIYNPARLNPRAMRAEMPVRYWKDLPEVAILPTLITESKQRVAAMVARQQAQPSAAPYLPAGHSLTALAAALPLCRGCELYCHATQAVAGRGDPRARLMLVGEQPGDLEDKRGEPFVGPAGGVLNRILEDLRIPRTGLFVTNAVKHFKFVQRGKLRLHQNPRMSEISACRPWLQAEIEAVQPRVVLCLGASAAKSLLGGTFALMKDHGKPIESKYAKTVFATIHPSAVLRARDEASRQQLHAFLSEDLARAWHAAINEGESP